MKLIFLGAQGSGKSTQAKIAAERLHIPQIEMGQMLRDKAAEHSDEGRAITKALGAGVLVPNEITIDVLSQRIKSEDCKGGYILDGYPRNQEQLDAITDNIDRVFYVWVADEIGVKRSMTRARADDTPELLKIRLNLYHEQTEPLLNYFRNKGILEEVNGERSVAEIEEDIKGRLMHVTN